MIENILDSTCDKYIPYYYDIMFYKIFGDTSDTKLLKHLLVNITNMDISKLEILNGKVVGDHYDTKRSYLDLLVKLNDSIKVNIEVNNDTSQNIKERNISFLLKVASNDFKVSEPYRKLNKHIQYNLNVEGDDSYSIESYVFKERKSNKILTEQVEIVNINLSFYSIKCYNEGIENLTEFEKLMGLLGSEDLEHNNIFANEKGILKEIMEKAEKFRNDSEIIEMYDRDLTIQGLHELDKEDAIKEAIQKNTEEVTKEVTKEVSSSTTCNIAVNMLNMNMNLEVISKATGLSVDELNELKKELD